MKTVKDLIESASSTELFGDLSTADKEENRLIAETANLIRSSRKSLGMTQKDLAQKMNVTQSMISQWEEGDCNFSLGTLAKIFTALKVRIEVIPCTGEKEKRSFQKLLYENIQGSGQKKIDDIQFSEAA